MVAPDGSAIKSFALNFATFSIFALTAAWFHFERFFYLKLLFIVLGVVYVIPPKGFIRQCDPPVRTKLSAEKGMEKTVRTSATTPRKRPKKARKED
mmetsp:Transcript_11944/g.16516  ORF Transcript_11944/g.16516 Transcript_11944/m.16516 type:complete len:96 (-) Transcript_11944:460-747(-)